MARISPDNFLALDGAQAAYETSRFAILPIPYDATASFGTGARDGPRAIITASQHMEDYDEALGRESIDAGIATLDPLEPDARGPEFMTQRISRAAGRILRDGKFPLGLGGDHSVSIGLIEAASRRYRDLSVLQIDAHADLRESFQGSPFSHACVMRRVHEMGLPTVGVGIRSLSTPEAKLIRSASLVRIFARECREGRDWITQAVDALSERVYVTIDIDAFDPAYAPGTGTPEPGGLDWYQVTDLLAAVAARRQIVAADVVEVRPMPGSNVTEFLAARLAYRLIGLVAGRPGDA